VKIAFVFPGQGSQFVGMCSEFIEQVVGAKEVLELGEKVTGIPIWKLVLQGPMDELTKTSNLQPCLMAVDVICCIAAEANGIKPEAVAGHSLGEYPALWACGVLSLEDTFRLVHLRGRLMEGAGEKNPGAMAAIIGLSKEDLHEILAPLKEEGVIELANHNSPEQIVITGEKGLVYRACQAVKEKGKRAVPLKISGAFHSPLMRGPAEEFSRALDQVEFKTPKVPLYSNVSAQAETDPLRIKDLMKRQMQSPVRWYEIVTNMANDGFDIFVELGPKKVLTNLINKCLPDNKAIKTVQIQDPEGLKEYITDLQGV